jgi:hypothetical protein
LCQWYSPLQEAEAHYDVTDLVQGLVLIAAIKR